MSLKTEIMATMRTLANPATIASGSYWIVNCERDTHLDSLRPYDALLVDNRSAQPLTVKVNQSDDLSRKQRAKVTMKYLALGMVDGVLIANDGTADIAAGDIILSFIKGTPSQIGFTEEGGATTYVVNSAGAVINPATSADLAPLSDDTIKGLLRSVGDAGNTPSNISGRTLLGHADDIKAYVGGSSALNAGILTTTPLGANATYDSSAFDCSLSRLGFACCVGIANQASANNGVQVQLSNDALSAWEYVGAQTTATANVGVALSQEICARYVRFSWTNGATAQTTFKFGKYFHL